MRKVNNAIQKPLWTPSAAQIASSHLNLFQRQVEEKLNFRFPDYPAFHQWSVNNSDVFWSAVASYCGINFHHYAQQTLSDRSMPGAKWFVGATLNFAENLLARRDDTPALIYRSERGERTQLSFRSLFERVAALAQWLQRCGVVSGDRVAAVMPNIPDTVVAMLATTSIGAIWSSCSPEFGEAAIVDRFKQIAPKILFVVNGYSYNGKVFDLSEKISRVVATLSSVQHVVVTNNIADKKIREVAGAEEIEAIIGANTGALLAFASFPFDHPLYILYSSGTTGIPKCIVHGAGGTLLQHLKELVLHSNLQKDDRIFYATSCGWMMWNWLVSSLAVGASVVLYDGSPLYPTANVLFDLVDQEDVAIFGTSAKYLSALEKSNVKPHARYPLKKLRTILSTGSPLLPESFDYVYREIKSNVCLSSISGGTDIVSCFALGNPTLPVYRGELQSLGLGMDVKIFSEQGKAITEKPGELVCTSPFPSMPVYFWNDPGGEKYHASYFAKYPGVWCHGDWAEITEHHGLIIYGRSDATLNPGGVRIGTAEIYRQVEAFPEIVEAVAVAQEWEGDIRIILFVRMRDGTPVTDELRAQICTALRINYSPRHVPAKIIAVPDIPRTMSGKIVELAIRNAIHDRPIQNLDALANPEALTFFKNISDLQLP